MNRLFPLFALAVVIAACGESGDHASDVNPPDTSDGQTAIGFERADPQFRRDGTLTVLRDAEPLATLAIEIADTDSTRERGMMERTSMPEDAGMLFIFPRAAPQGFWMANTPLSLDIIYADADSIVVSLAKYATPFSSETLPSGAPARFVLELEAGQADRFGIIEGDRLRWTRDG